MKRTQLLPREKIQFSAVVLPFNFYRIETLRCGKRLTCLWPRILLLFLITVGLSLITFQTDSIVSAQDKSAKLDKRSKTELEKRLRTSVEKALVPIQTSMKTYRENRRCFSCHHHAHPIVALTDISKRGFKIDRENLQVQIQRSIARTKGVQDRYEKQNSIGGGVDTTGHAMWVMQIGKKSPDSLTDSMVNWLLKRDTKRIYWRGTKNRAPTQTSEMTRAWLCVNALNNFAQKDDLARSESRIAQVTKWLEKAAVGITEDHVSRLRLVKSIGDLDSEIPKYAEELIRLQRSDGGWAPLEKMESDAYSTATALLVLTEVAGVKTKDERYQRGIEYLLSSQLKDGTWHVKTRATPVQEYFESGFPHGKDQFISFTATCWSAMAIAKTFPEIELAASASGSSNSASSEMATRASLEKEQQILAEAREKFSKRFEKEVWPLLAENGKSSCTACHTQKHRSSLQMAGKPSEDFQRLLADGFLIHGDPGSLLSAVRSKNPRTAMPPGKRKRWNDSQVELLENFMKDLGQFQSERKRKKPSKLDE